jgi:hypothetical protein
MYKVGADHFRKWLLPPVIIVISIWNIPYDIMDYMAYIWIINHLLSGMHIQLQGAGRGGGFGPR